jgi:hypothetical protein
MAKITKLINTCTDIIILCRHLVLIMGQVINMISDKNTFEI